VRLMSQAGTGFFYTVQRPRLKPKMVLRKYDPVGECQQRHDQLCTDVPLTRSFAPNLPFCHRPVVCRVPVSAVRQHVLFKEGKK